MFLEYPYLNIPSHRDLRSLFLCVSVSQDIQGNVYILLHLHRLHVFFARRLIIAENIILVLYGWIKQMKKRK